TSPCGARAGRVAAALAGLVADVLPPGPAGGLPRSVGVAVPGIVRRADGHVHLAPNLGWSDVPFGRLLHRRIGGLLGTAVPVLVGNDADLGARAEHARGAAAGSRHVIYLSGHVGLGAGVIVDGRPLSGLSGYGGEVGHVKVSTAGRSCRCGSYGCWETEVGEEALLARAGHPPDAGTGGVRAVLAEAAAGSPRAEAALAETGRWLGLGIANLVNIFNPELVVVGGVMRLVLPSVEEVVGAQLTAFALGPSRAQVRLALPALDLDSALVGAAELAFEALLADPLGALPGGGPS
ncbi:MAG TPA: ROK family protein, partial [Frankiaceae bacterium]|nr:ROK family protein [Frankiaceae bacterium]